MKSFDLIVYVAGIRPQIQDDYTNGISYLLWKKSKIFLKFCFLLISCSFSNAKIFCIGIHLI